MTASVDGTQISSWLVDGLFVPEKPELSEVPLRKPSCDSVYSLFPLSLSTTQRAVGLREEDLLLMSTQGSLFRSYSPCYEMTSSQHI